MSRETGRHAESRSAWRRCQRSSPWSSDDLVLKLLVLWVERVWKSATSCAWASERGVLKCSLCRKLQAVMKWQLWPILTWLSGFISYVQSCPTSSDSNVSIQSCPVNTPQRRAFSPQGFPSEMWLPWPVHAYSSQWSHHSVDFIYIAVRMPWSIASMARRVFSLPITVTAKKYYTSCQE